MGGAVKAVTKPLTSILGGNEKPAPAPAPPPPAPVEEAPVPMADDEENRKAARRRVSRMSSRSGRASTILTDTGGKLGG